MRRRSISIKEISALAGVSIATVSRVINQNGRFSPETEERVRKVIKEYGYEPDLVARSLRTNKMQVVGIIVPDITNEFFARVTQELQHNLFALGFSAIICNTNEEYDKEKRYLAMLKSQKVSGLIYISGEFADGKQSLQVPTIYIDRKPPVNSGIQDYVLIESDNAGGGYEATKALLESGCRQIALVTYRTDISSHGDRMLGYKRALQEHGIPFDPALTVQTDKVDMACGFKAADTLLREHSEIDGFFCTADLLAFGVRDRVYDTSAPTGRRLRLIGFDDLSFSGTKSVALSSVRQSVREFGQLGAETLVAMINGQELQQKQYLLPVQLIQRATS